MPNRKSDPDAKPVFDAINDTVASLSDLIRSLRASAASAKRDARAKARDVGKRVKDVKRKAGRAKEGFKHRVEKAWDVLAHGEDGKAAAPVAPARGRARRRRTTSS